MARVMRELRQTRKLEDTHMGNDAEKDIVKGKVKQVEGKVQQGVGKLGGDPGREAGGWAKEQHGKAQEGVGQIKDSLDGKNDGN